MNLFAKYFLSALVENANDSSVFGMAPGTGGSFGNTDSWNPGRTDIAVALGTNEKVPGKNKSAAKSKKKKVLYMRRVLNTN
jgi:hypothetical protein